MQIGEFEGVRRKTTPKPSFVWGSLKTEGEIKLAKEKDLFEKLHFELGGHIFGIGAISSKVRLVSENHGLKSTRYFTRWRYRFQHQEKGIKEMAVD